MADPSFRFHCYSKAIPPFSSMKILNATWFTDMGNPNAIGIVIAETEGEENAFIGRSRGFSNSQYGEFEDAQWISIHRKVRGEMCYQ